MYQHNLKWHIDPNISIQISKNCLFLENSTFIQECTGSKWTKFLWNYFPCSHKNPPVIIIGIIRHMICSRPRAPLTQISGRKERGKMFLTHRAFELKVTTWHFYRYLSHFGPPKNRHRYFLCFWNPDQFHFKKKIRMNQKQVFHLKVTIVWLNTYFGNFIFCILII